MAERPLVLVDGRLLRRRHTGVATHIRELGAAIAGAPPRDLDVRVVFGPPGLPRRGRLTSLGNLFLDLVWLHAWLPLRAWWQRARLVHAPVNWAPWWSPCPTVVTVHDLLWERMPEAYPAGFRRYARLFARRSVRRARLVIAVSETTARDLGELYGVPPGRLRVVSNGVRAHGDPHLEREPFVLSVGEFEPRKRVLELIQGHAAYLAGAPADPPPCRLVVAGAGGSQEREVRRLAGPGCELRGFVPYDGLAELYRRATLLVFPSRDEGFGLPVLEAMAHGCPVLLARGRALVEVGGDVALYLEDTSPAAIAEALAAALSDRPALAERGEASRRRAAGFSWERAAAATLAVYREALAR